MSQWHRLERAGTAAGHELVEQVERRGVKAGRRDDIVTIAYCVRKQAGGEDVAARVSSGPIGWIGRDWKRPSVLSINRCLATRTPSQQCSHAGIGPGASEDPAARVIAHALGIRDRKSTRLNSSH